MRVPAKDLKVGDRLVLDTLTVASVATWEGKTYIQFEENMRVEVLDPEWKLMIDREEEADV